VTVHRRPNKRRWCQPGSLTMSPVVQSRVQSSERSGSFKRTQLGRLVIDLPDKPIQAAVATEESPTIAEDVRELLFDVGQHFCAKRNAVVGKHRIKLGCREYHFSTGRLGMPCNLPTIVSPASNNVVIGGKGRIL